jgi:hypothetical protein
MTDTLSPEPEHEPQFLIDVVATDHAVFLAIECTRCMWMVEVEAPMDLVQVNGRATEHAERCKC